jgi:hypothetical protein
MKKMKKTRLTLRIKIRRNKPPSKRNKLKELFHLKDLLRPYPTYKKESHLNRPKMS